MPAKKVDRKAIEKKYGVTPQTHRCPWWCDNEHTPSDGIHRGPNGKDEVWSGGRVIGRQG